MGNISNLSHGRDQRTTLLLHLDGRLPNLALMRLSAHFKKRGDRVILQRVHHIDDVVPFPLGRQPYQVFASMIFQKTRPIAKAILQNWPDAVIGGTGWNLTTTLEQYGVGQDLDYSIYPRFTQSIGFSQRGCRLKCGFCVVPIKEGAVRMEKTITGIWRGDPYPKQIVLLDNDVFGQPQWKELFREIREGGFQINFNQGINARFLTDETAKAIASVDYRDVRFKRRCVYTAWDNLGDEKRLFSGLNLLVKHGIKPRNIMVYMLIGYWPKRDKHTSAPVVDSTELNLEYEEWKKRVDQDWEHRRRKLREFGADPYPMPFIPNRNPKNLSPWERHLIGFQRFVVGAYDKRVSWEDFKAAKYQPRNLQSGIIPT